jgi:hypothetical protein
MKTKSAVRPRNIQRTVLNLERPGLGLNSVEDAIIRLYEIDVMRDAMWRK